MDAFTYVHNLALGQLKIVGIIDPQDEFVIDESMVSGDFLKCIELTFNHTDGSRYIGTYTHNELLRMCPSHCSRSAIGKTMSQVPMVFGYVKHMIIARFEDNEDDGSSDETIDLRLLKQDDVIERSNANASELKQAWHESSDKPMLANMSVIIPKPIGFVDLGFLGDQLARIEKNIAILAKTQLLQYATPEQQALDCESLGELLGIVKQSSEQFLELSSCDDIYLLLRSSGFLMAASAAGMKFSDLKQQSASDCVLSRYISTHVMSEDPDVTERDHRPEIRALISMGVDVNHEHRHVSRCDYPGAECMVCGDVLNYGDLTLHTSPFKVIIRMIKEAPFDQKLLDSLFEIKEMLKVAVAPFDPH
jgi:hypothetical protein